MKNKKIFKFLSLLLALSFAMVACGTQTNDTNTDDKEAVTESTSENKDDADDKNDTDNQSKETSNDNKDDVNESYNEDDDKESANITNSNSDSKGIENRKFEIDFDKAISIFYEHYNDTSINIKSIDFDEDSGAFEYEIEGWNDNKEFKLTIDATSGKTSEEETENDNENDEKLDISKVIKPNEAMEIALKNSNGGYVENWELSFDDDKNVYEINIENGEYIDLDALTKEILERD